MRPSRIVGLSALATAIICVATACSGPASSAGPSSPTSKVVGIVTISATDANNARVIAAVKDEAESNGWKVNVVDAQGSADQANAAMTSFVSQKVEKVGMILDLVFPTSSLGTGLAAARQAGIPVGTWGGGIASGVVATTGDGAPFATPSTEALVKDIGETGSVLALTYNTGQVCRDRTAIFDSIIKKHPGIKVTKNEVNIPGQLQDGAKYASAWLAAHPEGSGKLAIWGCWEDPTLGAISALKQSERTDVLTYGINGSSTAIKAVQAGDLTNDVYEDAGAEGKTLFKTVREAIDAGKSWTAKTVDVPGIVVTKENIDSFLKDHPDALK
jgi:ribose transport system substrate-binding protein